MIGIILAIVGGTIISNAISPDLRNSLLSEQLKLFKNTVFLETQITISLNKRGFSEVDIKRTIENEKNKDGGTNRWNLLYRVIDIDKIKNDIRNQYPKIQVEDRKLICLLDGFEMKILTSKSKQSYNLIIKYLAKSTLKSDFYYIIKQFLTLSLCNLFVPKVFNIRNHMRAENTCFNDLTELNQLNTLLESFNVTFESFITNYENRDTIDTMFKIINDEFFIDIILQDKFKCSKFIDCDHNNMESMKQTISLFDGVADVNYTSNKIFQMYILLSLIQKKVILPEDVENCRRDYMHKTATPNIYSFPYVLYQLRYFRDNGYWDPNFNLSLFRLEVLMNV